MNGVIAISCYSFLQHVRTSSYVGVRRRQATHAHALEGRLQIFANLVAVLHVLRVLVGDVRTIVVSFRVEQQGLGFYFLSFADIAKQNNQIAEGAWRWQAKRAKEICWKRQRAERKGERKSVRSTKGCPLKSTNNYG